MVIFFILVLFIGRPLFAEDIRPLDDYQSLSIQEKYSDLKNRLIFYEWGELSVDERQELFSKLGQEASKSGYEKGIIFAHLLKTHFSDFKNQAQRIVIRKTLTDIKPKVLSLGDSFLQSYFSYLEGLLFYGQNEKEKAASSFESAVSQAKDAEKLIVYSRLSHTYKFLGKLDQAFQVALTFNESALAYGMKTRIAETFELLGALYLEKGEHAKSVDASFSALKAYKDTNDYVGQVYVLNLISINKFNLNQKDQQLKYLLEAEKLFGKRGVDEGIKSVIYGNISGIYASNEKFDLAEVYVKKAIDIALRNKNYSQTVASQLSYAQVLIQADRPSEAIQLMQDLKKIDQKYWHNQYKAWFSQRMASAYLELKKNDLAKPYVAEAIALSEKFDRLNLESNYELAISFYQSNQDYKSLSEVQKKLADYKDKRLAEEKKKLLYAQENENLAMINKQNSLVLESQKTKIFSLFGLTFSVFIILGLQLNRNRIIRAKNNELARKETIVREKTKDLQGILDNIRQGVMSINLLENGDHKIKDTSLYFFEIFSDINKEDLLNNGSIFPLFEGTSLSSEDIAKINSVFVASAFESIFQWEVNISNLPSEMILHSSEKVVEIDWAAVLEDEVVNQVIVTFKDVTEVRRLDRKSKVNEANTRKLVALATMDQKEYFLLISSIKKLLDESIETIKSHKDYLRDALDLTFRNLHTIKGLARSYTMTDLSSYTHDIENIFQKSKDQVSDYDNSQLLASLLELKHEVESYVTLAREKLRWDEELSAITVPINQLTQWYGEIFKVAEIVPGGHQLDSLLKDIKKRYSTTLNDTLNNILLNSQKLSKELDKGEVEFVLEGCDLFVAKEFQEKVSFIFVHLIRNSIDHGFATKDERNKQGLPPPKILILVSQVPSNYLVKIEDNGMGLNLIRVREKAKEKGFKIENKSDIEIANYIFQPGFSTKTEVTDISGRGVGMDAVANFLAEVGGDIKILPRGDANKGYLPVAFEMKLPAKFFET